MDKIFYIDKEVYTKTKFISKHLKILGYNITYDYNDSVTVLTTSDRANMYENLTISVYNDVISEKHLNINITYNINDYNNLLECGYGLGVFNIILSDYRLRNNFKNKKIILDGENILSLSEAFYDNINIVNNFKYYSAVLLIPKSSDIKEKVDFYIEKNIPVIIPSVEFTKKRTKSLFSYFVNYKTDNCIVFDNSYDFFNIISNYKFIDYLNNYYYENNNNYKININNINEIISVKNKKINSLQKLDLFS